MRNSILKARVSAVLLFAVIALVLALARCSTSRDLIRMDVLPEAQSLTTAGETVQFSAIGHFNRSPTTQDITNQVSWRSSDVGVATVDAAGLATATGLGQTTIIASSTAGSNKAEITAQADLTVGAALPTLSVTTAGVGSGVVTSSPVGINCGQTCSAQFVLGATVTLSATPNNGSTFGNWAGCDSVSGTTCTVVLNSDRTVTATFD